MRSPGKIVIYLNNHIRLAQNLLIALVQESGKKSFFTKEVFTWIVRSSVNCTYCHELFHHAMDVLQKIIDFNRKPDPEEPLAVNYSKEQFISPRIVTKLSTADRHYLKDFFIKERFNPSRYHSPYNKFINLEDFPDDELLKYVTNHNGYQQANRQLMANSSFMGFFMHRLVKKIGDFYIITVINPNSRYRIVKCFL